MGIVGPRARRRARRRRAGRERGACRGTEIWDGAHTPEAVRYIAPRLPTVGAIVASILRDKDADGMLAQLGRLADALVATVSSNERALSAEELAERARPYFEHVEAVADPTAALARGHELGEPVLVTGSLYLLADLRGTAVRRADVPWASERRS